MAVCMLSGMLPSHAAAAELQEIAWQSDETATHRFTLLPGKFAELCGRIAQGQDIAWRFVASQPLDFNIHYHADKQVVEPVNLNKVAQTSGSITASSTEDYCWMWSYPSKGAAKNSPARLEVTLERRTP